MSNKSFKKGPAANKPDSAPLEEMIVDPLTVADVLDADSLLANAEPTSDEQLAEMKDQLLRALAEVENTRKRAMRERDEMAQYAVTNFARDLLSVADNLNRAIDSFGSVDDAAVKSLLEGVSITEKELLKVFEKYKISRIEAVGKPFDHNLHQALIEIPTVDQDPGIVVQEMQVGYTIADRLLRPSMVGVAKKLEN